MKSCLNCHKAIVRRTFCSKICAGAYRSKNQSAITKSDLSNDYLTLLMPLEEISIKRSLSITTICKYLKKYDIPQRTTYYDFSDKKIGSLTIIEPLEVGHKGGGKHIKWRCKCDCGNEHIAYSHHLSRSLSVRCKQCADISRRSELELKKYIWSNFKRSAVNRGLDFQLDREWAYDLFLQQQKKCALSGVIISFAKCASDHVAGMTTASLDRIDSGKGYLVGNVQWVHKTINFMKAAMPVDEFLSWCSAVTNSH